MNVVWLNQREWERVILLCLAIIQTHHQKQLNVHSGSRSETLSRVIKGWVLSFLLKYPSQLFIETRMCISISYHRVRSEEQFWDLKETRKWTYVKEHFEYLILIYGKQPIFFIHVSVLAPFPNHNQASHNCSLITNNSILPNKTNNLCMMWVYNPRSWGAEAGRWRELSSGFWAKSYITLLLCTPFILSQKTLHIVVISSQNLKCLLLSDRLYIDLQHNIPVLLYK